MEFICFQSPSTAHNPFPGVLVTATDSAAAAAIFAQGAGISAGNVCAVPKSAFEFFRVGGVTPITQPAYV